jgi:hypothetical protein
MASKEVAVKEEAKLPSAGFDASRFLGHGTGLEKVTSSDLLIPRLTILQSNSPQCTLGTPDYNEKYRPGMIFDTGLNEIIAAPLIFVPVQFDKIWIEWFPRETKKGIAQIYDNDAIMNQTSEDVNGRDVLPNGNYVAETVQIMGLNVNANLRPSFIGMVSTQLKKSRRWLTLATSEEIMNNGIPQQAPFFYRSYSLGTTPESNAKGNWIGWTLERGKSIMEIAQESEEGAQLAERIFQKAVAFKKSIDAGEAKADTSTLDEGLASGGGAGRSRAQADDGGEM